MGKTYSVHDLFNRIDVVARNKLVVGIEELDPRLFKRTLGQQQTLDPRKALCRKSEIVHKKMVKTSPYIREDYHSLFNKS
jgi:hypothetical protein